MDKGIEELLNKMKSAAEKATPGQWSAFIDVASSTYSVFAKKVDDVISWMGFDGRKNASNNAKFIAIASPKNVLSMIAALEQAQQESKEQSARIAELEARTLCVKLPDEWISVSDGKPDPDDKRRVCVYTPSMHEDLRYRFVAASLFKAVCSEATHWYYTTTPGGTVEGSE